MDELRLIQNTTNIMPLQLVTCFLRFIGVYVHEGEKTKKTEGFLKDIYFFNDEGYNEDLSEGIFIVDEKSSNQLTDRTAEVVYVKGREKSFLKNFAKQMLRVNKSYLKENKNKSLLGKYTIEDIVFLADRFVDNKIMRNICLTKCFYKNPWFLEDAERSYKCFLNELNDYIELKERKKNPFIFVLLYTHYEMNCMYKKNNVPLRYDMSYELELCSHLLQKVGQNHIALRLLMGDIWFEVEEDSYEAYQNYASLVLERDIAYAWYKMGNIFSKVGNDIKTKNSCYIKATNIKDNYYQAWYQLALGYEKIKENERAVDAYGRVIKILADKRKKGMLQPIEIEFIFKSFLRMEKIFTECDNNVTREIWAIKNEIQIIREVDTQKFLDEILYGEKQPDILKIKYMVNREISQRMEMSSKITIDV